MQYDHISQGEKTRLKKSNSWWRNLDLKITNTIEFCQDLPSSYTFSREASIVASVSEQGPDLPRFGVSRQVYAAVHTGGLDRGAVPHRDTPKMYLINFSMRNPT